jgi:hypothetical protein
MGLQLEADSSASLPFQARAKFRAFGSLRAGSPSSYSWGTFENECGGCSGESKWFCVGEYTCAKGWVPRNSEVFRLRFGKIPERDMSDCENAALLQEGLMLRVPFQASLEHHWVSLGLEVKGENKKPQDAQWSRRRHQ